MNMYDMEVKDRKTFIQFLDLLWKDFLENPEDWENITVPDFIEAMEAYTDGIDGYYKNTNQDIDAEKVSWKLFADIFLGAKVYE